MKKMKLVGMLAQGVVLVGLSGGFFLYTQTQINPKQVFTYSRDIPVNTELTEGDFIKKVIPNDGVTKEMITDLNDVVGKVTTVQTFKGEYAIKNQLTDKENTDVFLDMDLSGYRKLALQTDYTNAAGGNIKKGDTVDLYFIGKGEGTNGDFVYSKAFMQDVLVYNVIDDSARKYIDQSEGTSTIVDSEGNPVESGGLSVITLAVTPEQAEEITARLSEGSIKVIGRFADSVDVNSSGYVIGNYTNIPSSKGSPEN